IRTWARSSSKPTAKRWIPNSQISVTSRRMAEETKKKRIFDFSLLRRVFHYAAPYKKRLYWSVFLSILLAILSPLRPFLIQVTINDYIRKGVSADLSLKDTMMKAVIWITVIQVGLLLIE